eukprot:780213-Prorocentrum_lima.AAC.1
MEINHRVKAWGPAGLPGSRTLVNSERGQTDGNQPEGDGVGTDRLAGCPVSPRANAGQLGTTPHIWQSTM